MALGLGTAVAFLTLDASGFARGVDYAVNDVHKLDSHIDSTGGRLETLGGKFMSAGTVLTAGLTAPIAAFGISAIKSSAEFDTSMSNVKALSMATAQDVDEISKAAENLGVSFKKGSNDAETAYNALRATAMEMGERTKFTAKESADALSYMSLAGWDAAQSIAGIEGVLSLAAAGNTDLARTSDIVTDAITGFGKVASDTAKVSLQNGLTKEIGVSTRLADIMAATMANSNTTVDMLGDSFKYVTPLAGSMGYSMEDVSLALGLMANAGVKSTQSGTALRQGIKRLISPTESAAAALNKYNISAFNSDGSVRPLRDTLESLRGAFGKLDIDVTNADGSLKTSEEIMEEYGKVLPTSEQEKLNDAVAVFGTTALPGMLAMMNATDDEFDSLAKAIDDSSDSFILYNGEVLSMADAQKEYGKSLQNLKGDYEELGAAQAMSLIQLDNLEGDWTLFKSALGTTRIILSDMVKGALREFVQKLTDMVRAFNDMDPKMQKFIVKLALAVAAIGPMLLSIGGIMRVIARVRETMAPIMTGISTLMRNFRAVTSQIRLMTPRVGGLKAGFDGLKTAIAAIGGPVTIVIAVIVALVAAFILLYNKSKTFRDFCSDMWEKLKGIFVDAGERIREALNAMGFDFEDLAEMIEWFKEKFMAVLEVIMKVVITGLVYAIQGVVWFITRLIETISAVVQACKGNKDALEELGGGWQVFGTIIYGIVQFIKGFIQTIVAVVEACKGNKDALGELGTGWQIFGTIIYGIVQFIKGFIQTIMAVVEAARGNTAALGELGIGWQIFGTIIYGVVAVIKSIINFIKNLIKYLNGNDEALDNVGPGWKVLAVIIKGVITVIKSIINNIKNVIKYLGGNEDALDELGPGWKVLAVIIKTVITVVKSIINFIKNLIEYLNGNDEALDKVGPGWKVLMVIIKTVITVVKSIINFIKNLIEYLGGNEEALDKMGPGWKVLAVVIKAVITVIKVCVKVIKTIIKVIKKIIEVVANVIKAFVDFAQGIWDGIQTAWGYITGFVSDVLDAFGNIVDSVFGIGKNIVEGLWNGIKSLTSWIAEKIKGFCSSALDAIKSFFGIASPSKVMRDVVGKNLVLGLAKGLDMYGGVAVKSSEKMSSKITKTISKGFNKGYNQAVKEVQKANKKVTDLQKKLQKTTDKNEKEKLKKQIEAAKKQRTKAKEALAQLQEDYISYCEDYLSRQQKLYTMSNKQVVQYWKDLLAKTKKGTTAYKEIQAKLIEAQEDYYAGLVDEADSALSKIQDLQDVSITDQITYWEKVKKKCLEGSTAYEDATHKIAVLQKELNDTMAELEDEFTKGLAEAVADVKSNIESIIDSYNDAVESAKDSMMGIAGLFEAFERDEGSAADTLMTNLDTQIQGLEDFNAAIDKMYARGLPDDLIQSMQSLGPAALNNIEAILNMEDEMLDEYIAKWEKKSSLAGEIANKQVDKQTYIDQIAEAVKEGQDTIQELVDEYNSGLAELGVTTFKTAETFQQDLVDQIANTFGISANTLSNMIKSDMSDVGKNTVQFITSGLLKNEKALTTTLNNLVTTDKLEIDKRDYIKQGIMVDEGLIAGLSNYEPRVYAEAYYVGQQMANGVQRGMQSRLNAIIATAVMMVQQAVAAARAAAEVSSPSKAMRDQVGIWLPLGMAEGVKDAMPEAMGLIQNEIDNGINGLDVATIDMSNILDMRDVAMVMLDVFDTIEKGMRDMTNEMVEDLEQVVDKTSGMLYNVDDVKGSMNTLIDANNVNTSTTSPNVSANVPVGSGSETVEQTFIFNSPKSIDEIQAARLLKQTSRDLAQGFA